MATLLTLNPTWTSPVEVTLGYRTDTFRSRSGHESRRALRSDARKSLAFSVVETKSAYRKLKRTLSREQNADFLLADPTRSLPLYAGIPNGSTTASITSPPRWLQASAQVVLCDTDGSQAVYTVQSVTSTTVVFTAATARQWSQFSVIRPALSGTLGQSITATEHTDNTMSAKISFEVTPGSETYPVDDTILVALDNREVFSYRWNWADEVVVTHIWPIEQVDMGWGVVQTNRPVQFGTREQSFSLVLIGSEIEQFEGFLHRCKGKRGEFWMPTGSSDITLASPATGSMLTTTATQVSHSVFAGVAVYLRNGTTHYFKVTGCTGNTITLDRDVPHTFNPADVKKISWMAVSRLKDDDQTLEWLNDSVARVRLETTSLIYRPAESIVTANVAVNVTVPLPGINTRPPAATAVGNYIPAPLVIDEATEWVISNWGEPAIPAFNLFEHLVNSADKFLYVRM